MTTTDADSRGLLAAVYAARLQDDPLVMQAMVNEAVLKFIPHVKATADGGEAASGKKKAQAKRAPRVQPPRPTPSRDEARVLAPLRLQQARLARL